MAEFLWALSLGLGVAAHLLFFHRYETHNYIHRIVAGIIAIVAATTVLVSRTTNASIFSAAASTLAHAAVIAAGATGSTLVYRLFFNPLNRFPGPFAARLSDFYMAFTVGGKLNQYHKLYELHQKCGRIVRRGATELSIVDPDFVEPSYNSQTRVTKGPWYDMESPPALLAERVKAQHDRRRKLWIPAFSDKALREYEPRIQSFNNKFIARLAELNGKPMDVSEWFKLYAFDVMGSLAFGKNYRMLDSGEKHHALGLLTEGMSPLGLTMPVWFVRLLKSIPGDALGVEKFTKFCADEIEDAVRNNFFSDTLEKDAISGGGSTVTSWLYSAYKDSPNPGKNPYYQSDARLLIVAGADTTAVTFAYMFYELAQHPEDVKTIRNELKQCVKGDFTDVDIRHCEHLNATINETLRLHSPGPSGAFRLTPPEGLRVGETFIPGGTAYNIPFHVVARDESIYEQAPSFVPERWYSKPDMVKYKGAFVPFLIGSYNCIGKNVAMMELRTLTAKILLDYDVSFAPGEDGSRLENESKDHFTMSLAPLDLVFTKIK